MTDAEMVKAMEICKDKEIPCDDCPLVECGDCEGISRQYFYDRFNELKVENAALRERLEKAVELPYERKRLLWGDKDEETLLCPDCLTDLMGGIGDETFVVQCPNCGCFVDCMVEPIPFTEAAEAKLAELEEGKKQND